MDNKKIVDLVALVLVIVGAINWGLIGLLGMNLVTSLLGDGTMLTKIVYILIGLSGLYSVSFLLKK